MVAGHAAGQYTEVGWVNAWETEDFPITIPPGIVVEYWDKNGQHDRAVFAPGASQAPYAFQIVDGDATFDTKLQGYFLTDPLPIPDDNQGLQVRGFETAVLVDDQLASRRLRLLLDGVGFDQVGHALEVTLQQGPALGRNSVTVSRTLLRPVPPAGSVGNLSCVHTTMVNGAQLDMTLSGADIRPAGADYPGSVLGFDLRDGGTHAALTVRNVTIVGDPVPGSGGQAHFFQGAGLEAGMRLGNVDLLVENVTIEDCNGDGMALAIAGRSRTSTARIRNSRIQANGVDGTSVPPQAAFQGALPGFLRSGVQITIAEEAGWNLVEIEDCDIKDNYRHGIRLYANSNQDEVDAFYDVQLDRNLVQDNGLALAGNEPGHGLPAELIEAVLNLEVHRTRFVHNHSSGAQILLHPAQAQWTHHFTFVNSLFSRNLCEGGKHWPSKSDVAQLSVFVPNASWSSGGWDTNSALFLLSHLTITDNESPYGISIWNEYHDQTATMLWMDGFGMANCILAKNNDPNSDVAFYPEALPPGQIDDLFQAIFAATYSCDLGIAGAKYPPDYTTDRGNFYQDPLLLAVPFLGGLGKVLPETPVQGGATSPVIDRGMVHGGIPTDPTDVRDEDRTVAYSGTESTPDVGAVEVQEDE